MMNNRFPLLLTVLLTGFLGSCPVEAVVAADVPTTTPSAMVPARPVVALLTDFGLATEAVGLCHGAILSVDSAIRIVDLCHSVEAYDILQGALMLRGTTAFPRGTVVVGVIDPGVGTERKPVAIRTGRGYYYVAPNNGLLTYVIRDQGVEEVVVLDERRINPEWNPGTFDGRDLFSPAGALLASTRGNLTRIGRLARVSDLVQLATPEVSFDAASGALRGVYLRRDEPYGNVWTNITRDDVTSAGLRMGDHLRLTGAGLDMTAPLVVSFGHVAEGKPLAYFASNGALAFALNMGNFSETHAMKPGMRITVVRVEGDLSSNRSPVDADQRR